MPSVSLILAEFGADRFNNGDGSLPVDRLEPSLSSFRKYFPEATAVVYTDQNWESREGVEVRKIDPPFERSHSRYGNRCNDWVQAIGLMESKTDVTIAVDSDLFCVSDRIRDLIPLSLRFGLCQPVNGRHMVYRDARSDCDGGKIADESHGSGMCHCTALWALGSGHEAAKNLLHAYCDQMDDDARSNSGARGPLSLWRAQWQTGIFPYTLPSHYCVTGSNLWVPPDDAIVLHVGHATVREKYAALIS